MKWIPLDNYHQKPKCSQVVILSDGKEIYQDMVWLDSFTHGNKTYQEGWCHINGTEPMNINPTHWLELRLP